MAITAAMREEVSQLYVALFGRAPDGEGLGYWVQRRDAGLSVAQVANEMYATTPARSTYPTYFTNGEIINAFYVNVLGRPADTGGLAHWTAQLNTSTPGAVIAAMINNVMNYGGTDPQGLISAALFQNKAAVATAYGLANGSIAGATSILSSVTDAAATRTAALASITNGTAAGVGGSAGQTFTLTTGADVIAGTSGADVINAPISGTTSMTFGSLDKIDGGGGQDVLSIAVSTAGSYSPSVLKNVEEVSVSFDAAATLNLTVAEGLKTVTAIAGNSANDFTVQGLTPDMAINIASTGADATLSFRTGALAGSADNVSITASGMSQAATDTISVNGAAGGAETVTITATGPTSVIGGLTSVGATKLVLKGDAQLTVGTTVAAAAGNSLATTITSVDASAMTGGAQFRVAATGDVNVTGGAGNDTIVMASLSNTDTITGGNGTDTLFALSADVSNYAKPAAATINGVERLALTDVAGAVSITLDNLSSGITRIELGNDSTTTRANYVGGAVYLATNGATTVTGGAGALDVILDNALSVGTFTAVDTGTAGTDILNITNTASATNVLGGLSLASNGYETVNINTGSTGAVTGQTVNAITVTADGSADTTVKFSGQNGVTTTATTGIITAKTIDASGLVGSAALVMGAAAASVSSIIGGAGDDTLLGDASSNISGGDGRDVITGGSGNDTLSGGAGNDTITGGTGNDSIDGGAGNDTITMAGNLGAGDIIVGGDGTDTLQLSSAASAAGTSQISGVEVLEFNAASVQQDMTAFLNSGFTTALSTAASLELTNVQNDFTTQRYSTAASGTAIVDRLIDNTTNALTIQFAGGNTTMTGITVSDEETLTVGRYGTATAGTAALGTLSAADLTSLTITGDNNHSMTITNAAALATINAVDAQGTQNIDASSSTVNLTVTVNLASAVTITGGTGNDNITGGDVADTISGGAGNDTITGLSGNDTIAGGKGADSIVGGDGTGDTFAATGMNGIFDSGASLVSSGAVVNLSSSALSAASILALAASTPGAVVGAISIGLEQISTNQAGYLGATATATNYSLVSSLLDTLSGIENLTGSAGDDVLVGSTGANTISGAAGADYIDGGAGDDSITGGAGLDYLTGGTGNDRFDFTTDLDATTGGQITVTNGATNTTIANTDTISVSVMDRLIVNAGDTLFLGTALNVTLDNGIGNANTADGAVGTITLAGNANVGYIFGSLAGSTFTVNSAANTALMVFWDGDGGDTAAENYVILTGINFGTPTLAAGVLTVVAA